MELISHSPECLLGVYRDNCTAAAKPRRRVRHYARGRNVGTHSTAGWVGATVGLEALEKRKSPAPVQHQTTYFSVFVVTTWTELSRLVNSILEQTMEAQMGNRGIVLLFL
jgi:hypothetical protein